MLIIVKKELSKHHLLSSFLLCQPFLDPGNGSLNQTVRMNDETAWFVLNKKGGCGGWLKKKSSPIQRRQTTLSCLFPQFHYDRGWCLNSPGGKMNPLSFSVYKHSLYGSCMHKIRCEALILILWSEVTGLVGSPKWSECWLKI